MEKEKDYASDSDESDEDFRPDAAGESVSEEESNGEDSADGADNEAAEADTSKAKNVKKGKRLTKKQSKKRNNKKDSDDDDDDDDETENYRRSTRQTDGDLTNGKNKTIEKDTLESDEEDKSRTSALWADFLKDVNPVAAKTNKTNGVTTKASVVENASSSDAPTNRESTKLNDKPKETNTKNTSAKEEPEPPKKKVIVTEVLDFAGEEVRVQKEVDASSIKENTATVTAAPKMQPFGRIMPGAGIKRPAGPGTSGGIGSLLNQIGKKKKLSVLEKSQMDWKSFKTQEGIDEELQTFNKGKDGYLERQDFLQRTDLRQFEIEKSLRQSSRRPL